MPLRPRIRAENGLGFGGIGFDPGRRIGERLRKLQDDVLIGVRPIALRQEVSDIGAIADAAERVAERDASGSDRGAGKGLQRFDGVDPSGLEQIR